MSENTTTTTFKPATAKQRQLIADLNLEHGLDLQVPASARAASAMIAKTIKQVNEAQEASGEKPEPTLRQVRLLTELGAERGKNYKIPATRAQASAKIKQILAAGATTAAPEAEPETAEVEVLAAA